MDGSEQVMSEIMDDCISWMETAQVLAYLAVGLNGHNAEDTLRFGRVKIGKLFEEFAFDALCWKEIAQRDDIPDAVRVYAQERQRVMQRVADKAYARFENRTEGR